MDRIEAFAKIVLLSLIYIAIIVTKMLENHHERILTTIGQTWIGQKNRTVLPHEYIWGDFNAYKNVRE